MVEEVLEWVLQFEGDSSMMASPDSQHIETIREITRKKFT